MCTKRSKMKKKQWIYLHILFERVRSFIFGCIYYNYNIQLSRHSIVNFLFFTYTYIIVFLLIIFRIIHTRRRKIYSTPTYNNYYLTVQFLLVLHDDGRQYRVFEI